MYTCNSRQYIKEVVKIFVNASISNINVIDISQEIRSNNPHLFYVK
jgi:hypothetical protein